MHYYLMLRHVGTLPGHPVFLERKFDPSSGGENVRENPFVVFYTSYTAPPVVFLCKHSMLDFDFYELSAGEYFMSDRLTDALQQVQAAGVATIDVQFLSMKRQPISKKQYKVVRIREALSGVDTERSLMVPAASDPNQLVTKQLVLNHAVLEGHDVFRIKHSPFGACLFCSERFKTLAEERGAQLRFIPEAEAAAAYAEYDGLAPR
jgi:hypothetical protein